MINAMVLRPQTFDQLVRFSEMAASSQMVPRDYLGKPTNIMVAVQMGSEIGLAPMQALQNIAVINGRPSVWGDAMLALCKAHPAWGGIKEMIDGTDTDMVAVCEIHRKGDHPVISTFSVDDAKKANLWGKTGPWQQYPKRMLQMRARGFALRDAFPDALKGLISAEEAQDIPADDFKGPTINAIVEPPEPINTAPPAPRRTLRELLRDKLAACFSQDDVAAVADSDLVKKALSNPALTVDQINELNNMLAEAYGRYADAAVEAELSAAHEPEPADVSR